MIFMLGYPFALQYKISQQMRQD